MFNKFSYLEKIKDDKLQYLLITLSLITLPWSIRLNSLSIILFILSSILVARKHNMSVYTLIREPLSALCIFYFLLHTLTIFYSPSIDQGVKALEKKVSFLVIPISIYLFTLRKPTTNLNGILKSFVASVVLATLACLFFAIYTNLQENLTHGLDTLTINPWYFSYKLLSENIGIHPAYLALFVSLAIIILLKMVFIDDQPGSWYIYLVLLHLLGMLVLLASRNVLFSCSSITLATLAYSSIKRKIRLLHFVWLIVICLMSIGLVLSNEVVRSRFMDMIQISGNNSNWGNISLRLREWSASVEIIKNNFWGGVTPSGSEIELNKTYLRHGWNDLANESFNSHNQFIQTQLNLGVLGTIVLWSILAISFRAAIQRNDYVHLSFLLIFTLFSITESTLEVQKGIVGFTLINSLLYYRQVDRKAGEMNQLEI